MNALAIDRVRCDGHGLCRDLLPGRIELDEWGFPILRDPVVPEGQRRDVRRAVAACPALALRLNTAPADPSVTRPAARR